MAKKEKTKKENKGVSGTLIFTLVFVLCIALFGGGYWVWQFWLPSQQASDGDNTPTTTTTKSHSLYSESDRRNIMVIITDEQQDTTVATAAPTKKGGSKTTTAAKAGKQVMQTAVMLCIDAGHNRITATGLPAETLLKTGGEECRFADAFAQYGPEKTAQWLSQTAGFNFDHYLVLSADSVESLLTYYGTGLIYNVPEAVEYISYAGQHTLSIDGGVRALTPQQAANLLRYASWSGGRRMRANVHAQMMAAYFTQYWTADRAGSFSKDFAAICQHAGTDYTPQIMEADVGMLTYLTNFNADGGLCRTAEIFGDYTGGGSTLAYHLPSDVSLTLRRELLYP